MTPHGMKVPALRPKLMEHPLGDIAKFSRQQLLQSVLYSLVFRIAASITALNFSWFSISIAMSAA